MSKDDQFLKDLARRLEMDMIKDIQATWDRENQLPKEHLKKVQHLMDRLHPTIEKSFATGRQNQVMMDKLTEAQQQIKELRKPPKLNIDAWDLVPERPRVTDVHIVPANPPPSASLQVRNGSNTANVCVKCAASNSVSDWVESHWTEQPFERANTGISELQK